MKVCGIIAEYDPFHKGHQYHISRARELSRADYVVCVVSTAFTQRGTPSFFSTTDRARMALSGGADAVFSLPVSFSPAEADRFAAGGVAVLTGLGPVTHLAFGCEDAERFSALLRCAEALESPSPAFEEAMRQGLSRGLSYPKAQARALTMTFDVPPDLLDRPNNILALSYLKALRRLKAPLLPVPVQRRGVRDDERTVGFLSSSVLRKRLTAGEMDQALPHLPDETGEIVRQALREGRVCPPGALSQAVLYRLNTLSREELARYTTLKDGLPDRVLKCLPGARDPEELISLCVSARCTRAALRRFLSQALLDLPRDGMPPLPRYTRLLAFRESAAPLLSAIGKMKTIDVISKPADAKALLSEDDRAERIRGLGCASAPSLFTQSPIIVRRNDPCGRSR